MREETVRKRYEWMKRESAKGRCHEDSSD
jgi:hypothetical protein